MAEVGAGGCCDLPARRAGAFHGPCVTRNPAAGPRSRGWAARASGNGKGKGESREEGGAVAGSRFPALGAEGCAAWGRSALPSWLAFVRLATSLPGPSGLASPVCLCAAPAASPAPPQLLSVSGPVSQAALDLGLSSGPQLLSPVAGTLWSL